MTNEQAKKMFKAKLECLKRETSGTDFDCNNSNCDECSLCYEQGNMGEQKEALDMAIKALEQKPYEKFESAKDHIYKLAGDYKCWDNRLTKDEAVELCHILEQQPCEDAISRQAAIDAINGVLVEDDACKVWFRLALQNLPSAQPDKEKISDALYHIYRNKGTSTSAEGVAAIKYYIAEIWREIYGEEGPGWMKK